MSKDLNKVQIIGRLGKDVEMRFTPQGTPVANFTVAAGREWKDPNGEQRQETEWFSIVVWNKLAEICNQYLSKGSRVYIEGRLQTRSWDDDSGQKRFKTEVVANDMIILDKGNGGNYPEDADGGEDDYDQAPAPAAQPARQATRPAAQPNRPAAPAGNRAPQGQANRGNGQGDWINNNTRSAKAAPPARQAAKPVITDEDDLPF